MSKAHDRGRFDWIVEWAGAVVPASAAAWAAALFAPAYGLAPPTAMLAGFAGVFVIAFAAIRVVPPEPRHLPLPVFDAVNELLLDDVLDDNELLLDQPVAALGELLLDQPVVAQAAADAVAELLLEDPLPAPDPESRVVQLFAPGRMPTAGQLQRRIDRHLAGERAAPVAPRDDSDALSEALAELRRSLRQG